MSCTSGFVDDVMIYLTSGYFYCHYWCIYACCSAASAPYVEPPYETDSIQKDHSIEQDKPILW